MAITDGFVSAPAASDAGTEVTTSSGVPVHDNGVVILTPSAGSICSANGLAEVPFFGNLVPPVPLPASATPSVTSETAAIPTVDVEDLLQKKFNNLTLHEKARALVSVRTSQYSSSCDDSEAETKNLTQNGAAKIGDNGGACATARKQDSIKPSLADWQTLCKAVGVVEDEMPVSITQCKKTLKGYNANLYDVHTALRNGTVAQTFPSLAALARYSKREGKVMSKAVAKKDPLLKLMLRELFSSDPKRRGR